MKKKKTTPEKRRKKKKTQPKQAAKKPSTKHVKKGTKKATSDKVSKKKRRKKQSLYKIWLLGIRDYFIILLASVFLIGVVSSFFFSVINIEGYSMMPALRNKDAVVVKKTRTFKRFDLVVFQKGRGKTQVRRVIGFPDEKIELKEDILYVNGQEIEEKYLVDKINESQQSGSNFTENFSVYSLIGEAKIPKGKYLVLGDNRPYGTDSREYGLIDEKEIIGVVKVRLLPINNMERL